MDEQQADVMIDELRDDVDYLKAKRFAGELNKVDAHNPSGLKVAIEHKLAPEEIRLTLENYTEYTLRTEGRKYHFRYRYLDLGFVIRTDDDKVAAQLFPFFTDEQKNQLMAMTLGSKGDK